jgi:hypothetical protein
MEAAESRCYVRVGPAMNDDLGVLIDRIRVLLEKQRESSASDTTVVEHTLTDGYAHALALEAERGRAENRIRALAGDEGHSTELRTLKARVVELDANLVQLRGLLEVLSARR